MTKYERTGEPPKRCFVAGNYKIKIQIPQKKKKKKKKKTSRKHTYNILTPLNPTFI